MRYKSSITCEALLPSQERCKRGAEYQSTVTGKNVCEGHFKVDLFQRELAAQPDCVIRATVKIGGVERRITPAKMAAILRMIEGD